jgi:hypothetical protein
MRIQIMGLGVLAVVLFAGTAFAAEFDRTPDRFTSLGLTVNLTGASGDNTISSGGASASQDTASGLAGLEVDLRVPVSQSVTLSGALAVFGTGSEADETGLLTKQEINEGGVSLTLGMRYYFNR